jgi:hypothetical protein
MKRDAVGIFDLFFHSGVKKSRLIFGYQNQLAVLIFGIGSQRIYVFLNVIFLIRMILAMNEIQTGDHESSRLLTRNEFASTHVTAGDGHSTVSISVRIYANVNYFGRNFGFDGFSVFSRHRGFYGQSVDGFVVISDAKAFALPAFLSILPKMVPLKRRNERNVANKFGKKTRFNKNEKSRMENLPQRFFFGFPRRHYHVFQMIAFFPQGFVFQFTIVANRVYGYVFEKRIVIFVFDVQKLK